MTQLFRVCRILPVLLCALMAPVTYAADELLLYVFNNGTAVGGARVTLDSADAGKTRRDGSLFINLSEGQHVIAVTAPDGQDAVARFAAGSGQLVDVVVDMATNSAKVDVFARTQTAADRRDAPVGTLQVSVREGTSAAANKLVLISNGQGAVNTNAQGVASKAVPRRIYTVSVGDVSAVVRVAGGVTRGAQLVLPEDDSMRIDMPALE